MIMGFPIRFKDASLVASAPGRIDFLNTHQDYKGLPVVPVAINLRTYIAILEPRENFVFESLNLKEEGKPYRDEFEPAYPDQKEKGWCGNYLRAVVTAVEDYLGRPFEEGFHAVIYSEVPIGSGLASSAALEVALAKALDAYFNLHIPRAELAEICFRAENIYMEIPCGRLDQYSSTFGGAILLYPRPPVRVEELPLKNVDFVVVDSGIRHSVADIHPRRQGEINEGLRQLMESADVPQALKEKLGYSFDEPLWEEIEYPELQPYLGMISETAAKRITFTVLMNKLTMDAVSLIKSGAPDLPQRLGEIVNKQHELLRDLYEVSLPELEKIRDAMLDVGAYGVKISGAGMGGSLVAVTPSEEEVKRRIVKAAIKAGARKGWSVKVDEGARVDYRREGLRYNL